MSYTRLGGAAVAAIALLGFTSPGVRAKTDLRDAIEIGKMIAPVPLTIPSNVDPNRVYYGAYLVESPAGCDGCHSNRQYTSNGNPFNGQKRHVNVHCYMNGGQAFGPFISRNVTPDATGKPAGLTLAQFTHVFRTGEDPEHPGTLLQVMPWDGYQFMTGRDIEAVYDYLSSIPSLPMGGAGSKYCS